MPPPRSRGSRRAPHPAQIEGDLVVADTNVHDVVVLRAQTDHGDLVLAGGFGHGDGEGALVTDHLDFGGDRGVAADAEPTDQVVLGLQLDAGSKAYGGHLIGTLLLGDAVRRTASGGAEGDGQDAGQGTHPPRSLAGRGHGVA